jgi:tetratricopeptide (TPR) repeat protein
LTIGNTPAYFLSFGHWTASPQSQTQSAADTLLQSIDLAAEAERLGVGLNSLPIQQSTPANSNSSVGYGSKGSDEVLPDATLTYFIEVIDVKSEDLANVLYETVQANGIDAAVEQFHKLEAEKFPDMYLDELELNDFGYAMVRRKNFEGAIKIFQLNTEVFPDSANVYDSLGDAYARGGNKARAIESYQKALAIDPQKTSSSKALRELQSD